MTTEKKQKDGKTSLSTFLTGDKYKVVSLFLAIGLLAALVRLFGGASSAAEPKGDTVYKNLLARTSVRAYTDAPVSRETLDTLVRAGMAAPTAMDLRPWKFVVIDDKSVLTLLGNNLPNAPMAAEAAAAICVCGDTAITDREGRPSRYWVQDCSAASENILLCAAGLGLGAVWTGVYPGEDRIDKVADILSLPDNLVPLNVIFIGHPKETPQPKDKYDAGAIRYNAW